MITRFSNNPLIASPDVKPSRPDFEVLCVFNPGAALLGRRTLLLMRVAERPIPEKGYVATAVLDPDSGRLDILRVKLDNPDLIFTDPRGFQYKGKTYLTSVSHLRLAERRDGRHFEVAETPALMADNAYETFGIEDPRIVPLGKWFYITYSAVSRRGVAIGLARTRDFKTFEKLGIMLPPDNKDVAIFPRKIGRRYYALHRPMCGLLAAPSMWIASSTNLLDWGRHRFLIGPRTESWDSERVGAGASPVETADGWLAIYHASDHETRYCSGALLLDLDEPWRVIARSREPILSPEESYEREGFMPNVVFHNGLVDRGDGTLDLYYGAADDKVCGASVRIADILTTLKAV